MNIVEAEEATLREARTCGDKNKKVTCMVSNPFHSLFLDKKDILRSEIEASKMLLGLKPDEDDSRRFKKEITELRIVFDL
jgi:hypothetical protein